LLSTRALILSDILKSSSQIHCTFEASNIDSPSVRTVASTVSPNMKDVYYSPAEYQRSVLEKLEDNIKDDRTLEDLLFQVMIFMLMVKYYGLNTLLFTRCFTHGYSSIERDIALFFPGRYWK
jgi:hypothetical protein